MSLGHDATHLPEVLTPLVFLFFHYRVKLWADTFGGELYAISTKYSGSLLLQKVGKTCKGALQVSDFPFSSIISLCPGDTREREETHVGLH